MSTKRTLRSKGGADHGRETTTQTADYRIRMRGPLIIIMIFLTTPWTLVAIIISVLPKQVSSRYPILNIFWETAPTNPARRNSIALTDKQNIKQTRAYVGTSAIINVLISHQIYPIALLAAREAIIFLRSEERRVGKEVRS